MRDPNAVIDNTLYWGAPRSEEEAYYLCAVLNSEVARGAAAHLQAIGGFGARQERAMLDEALFWKRIRAHEAEDFKTLTRGKPNRVGRVRDGDLDVHSLSGDTLPTMKPPRRIARKELYSFYKAAYWDGPIIVKDIARHGRLAHLRETLDGRSGAALPGLLLHAFSDELAKVDVGHTKGLRAKEGR